jgi:CDP-glucose 4,6-dehydratase
VVIGQIEHPHMTSFWDGRRVLVTGATGMVGSWLTRALLDAQAYVVALVLNPDPQTELYRSGDAARVVVVSGALEDLRAVERAITLHEIDTVFHLGAQTIVGAAHRAPLVTFEANIRGTYNLLDICRAHHQLVTRIVVASSDKAYGEQQLPYTEDTPLAGRHPYEVSKSCTDLLAQCYHATYGLPVSIARCGNIYGGGDLNWSRIVPGAIRDCLQRRRTIIRSDGTCLRDYIYVKDAVSAYLRLAELGGHDGAAAGRAFNFSDESPRSVLDMLSAVQRLMGCEDLEPDIRNHAQGEIQDQYLAATRARAVLGWRPAFTLQQGLSETIEWYRDYLQVNRSTRPAALQTR